MNRFVVAFPCCAAALLAACVPRSQPPQAPTPPPAAPERSPVAPAPPPPPPPAADWRDAPLSPGDWSYSSDSGSATFANGGAPVLIVRCESPGRLSLIRAATGGTRITIRTSFGDRSLTALPVGTGLRATIAAGDPLLDQLAFSRGRFLVETDGAPTLIVPAWPEPARVVEDCRS